MLGGGEDKMPAGEEMRAESLDRRRRHHLVAARGHEQDRLADAAGVARIAEAPHQP
jgi:hypothetical protein